MGRPRLPDNPGRVRRRAYSAAYKKSNPVAYRRSLAKSKAKLKRRVFSLIGLPVCARCGCDDVRVLEINHIYGGGHREWSERIANGKPGAMIDAIRTGARDTKGLNILCTPCNHVDHLERMYHDLKGRCSVKWVPAIGPIDLCYDPWDAAGFPLSDYKEKRDTAGSLPR
jgi:hypothetical protein